MKKRILTIVLLIAALFTALNVQAQAPVDSPEEAIEGLLTRIGGDGAADLFEIVIDASLAENGKDVFIITSLNGKPCIKGNNQLSVATGINWYLNHYAHINLTWNNLTTDLSNVTLPVPTTKEKHISSAAYRYDFNTCTFSYSMAFWTWERWQQEIDWMALHGINAPLNLVGLDVVTRKFLRELGVSENDINDYIAGPGFIAWFAMNNLEGWGGTINANDVTMNGNPDWWYTRQEQLCRNMLQRMRELGMQPVIPGFSGQVPNCIVNYSINGFSSGDVVNNGTWAGGYTRPDILKPNTESYRTFAKVYYKHLHEVMGVSEFYSIDPFHEGSLPSGVTNENCYPNIMVELDNYYKGVSLEDKTKNNVDEQPKWIIQYWQGVPQSGAFSAMSSYGDRFIGLDLFSDAPGKAQWNGTYFQGRPYIFCMLHNFGGRSGMHGRLESTMNDYFSAIAKGNNCQGIGATPEGTETNPILYDMLFELPWMDPAKRPTADEWLADYTYSRYGVKNDTALAALQNLKKSVWNCPTDQQGTSEAVILARPNWEINKVSSWSTSAIYWDTQDVLLAADQLSSISDLITTADGTANYNYDFIDVVRQAMVDYAAQLLPLINAARGNNAEYTRLYQLYLQLMLDLDTMLSYDENFKLERWTSLARNIAYEVSGTTENDRRWLEWNARTQVTVWSKGDTDLHDYSNRCWAGLIKDFHYKRWEKFFTTKGGSFNGGWFSGFEYPWTVDFTNYNYSTVEIPDDMSATAKAKQTFGKYFGRIVGMKKNYLFPMGITTNATKSDVIPEIYRDKTVALPLEIGKDVTISSAWIDLNNDGAASDSENLAVTDGNKVAIPADAAIGKTTAKVTYSDGTIITFDIAIVEDIADARTVTAVAGANGSVAIEGTNEPSITTTDAVKITATANNGYNFENWTKDGEVVSNDNPFIYYGKDAATFTANFIQDKWGVPSMTAGGLSEAVTNNQYVSKIDFAYHNREAETIYDATSAEPTSLFTTIPQIIDVPQGASFTITWTDNGTQNLTKCYMSAYMDFNGNGNFEEEGELVKVVGTRNADNSYVRSGSFQVTLPYDAPKGITHLRMRFDSAWGNQYNSTTKAFNSKGELDRMCYEIIINVTEFSEKAAHIAVATNNKEWGTVKVWTDETPDGSTRTEWDVTKGVPFYIAAEKTSEDVEFLGWYDQYGRLVTMNLEHTMYAREDATYTAKFRKLLEFDGWQIEYRTDGKNVVLTKIDKTGKNDLVIPENVEILGEQYTVIGFENNLFNNNKELWSITLPKSMQFLSVKEVLNGNMTGKVTNGTGTTNASNYTIYNLEEAIKVADGFTVTVTGTSNGNTFNEWGSGLFATGTNPLAAKFDDGFQLYLAKAGNFVLKVDNGDKEYALDNSNCKVIAGTEFTAKIEYYNNTITITVNNGAGETGKYTRDNVTLADIYAFSAAIPQGISLNVNVSTAKEENPFSGCSNLDNITIDGTCANYYVNENGDLYNSRDVLICSPEGKAKGTDRRALAALIEDMKTLTSQVGTYNPTGTLTEVALQTANDKPYYIWCSNPHDSGDDAKGGVAALLDENDDTYLHTDYTNVSATNDFLQVELGIGNELRQFSIAGKQRKDAGYDIPKTIEIQGSSDKNSWETITTVFDLPQSGGAAWKSGVITTEKSYPYLRFVVTTGTNRKFFHMAKFDIHKVSASADVFSYLEGCITDKQAATAYDALLDAIYILDNGTTKEEMQAANTALQKAYDELDALLKAAFPIELTLDEANPVLYKINFKRGENAFMQFREDNNNVKLTNNNNTANATYYTFYFMSSENGVLIKPYNADGKVLGTEDITNGHTKISAVDINTENYVYEWTFVQQSDGYYNIKITKGSSSNYMSDFGNYGADTGFYGSNNSSDAGSLFKFIKVAFDNNNPRFYQLSDFKATTTIDGTNIYGGTSVGLYTGGKEYREAYTAAKELIEAGNTSNSEACHDTYKALRMASNNLSYNIADSDKFYVIKSTASNDYCKGKYVHTYSKPHIHTEEKSYDHRHLLYKEIDNIELFPLAVFQFEKTGTVGEYKMKNLHTGLYVKSFGKNADDKDADGNDAEHLGKEDDAAVIKTQGIADGQVILQIGDNDPMHAQQDFNTIVTGGAEANNASTWSIEEVKTPTEIAHPVEFTDVIHQTLYLNYDVKIPDGVEAYIATGYNDEWLYLDEIKETIPARTAVILKAPKGNYTFKYSENDVEQLDNNILQGTLWDEVITKDTENSYYVLANKDNEVGMYNPVNGTNEGEFKNNANKAYLQISSTNITSFAFFGFRDDEGATAIDEVNGEKENIKAIYDLTGRKIETPNKGIYIINGKKVLVK